MSNKETGLMKQTKAQLVDIIMRKDDEEARLKKDIESLKNDVLVKEDTCKKLRNSLEKANHETEQHQAAMDDLTTEKVEFANAAKTFEKERNNARTWNWVLATVIVIISALWILL